ncbi:MAG: hypothetical protein KA841_07610 [Chitinophagales bacterium]|nr:hypothetical protein [Chitinophagales bacterium]
MMKRVIVLFFLFVPIALQLESCAKSPFACFRTSPGENDIHVNQPITFTASCSSDGDGYFWEFYDDSDSSYFGYSRTQTFYDTGYVDVYLLVTNGRKFNSTTSKIHVKP